MKKTLSIILALVLALAALTGCGSSSTTATEATEAPAAETEATEAPAEEAADDSTAELEVIKVGASATPHAEILESVKDVLAAEGYDLQVVVYDDYILPNQALADGELDANYFQHTPYLNSYNASNGTDLVAAALIHYEPFGIYANGVASLDELAEGATILIPADDSNETRALFLLQQEGLITLPEDASAEVGVSHLDIVDDGGYNIVPVQADTVPSQLASSDEGTIAVINGNYAIQAGLKVADALATEAADGDAAQTYANIIAVRNGDENSEKIQALINALKTDAVKQFIDDNYDGAVVAIF
jgi:D-methionine transport system substrate-binding protein